LDYDRLPCVLRRPIAAFWSRGCGYIREVDPYEKIFTGMTRDGTFLIEGGRVTAGVRNFRFNQGLIEMPLERGGALRARARVGRRDLRHGARHEGARV